MASSLEEFEVESELTGLTSVKRDALILLEVRGLAATVQRHERELYGDRLIPTDQGLRGNVAELVLYVAQTKTVLRTMKNIAYALIAANSIGLLIFFTRLIEG